ncbi:PaaX family transcriptional regulator [Gordonia sp. NPDC003424]
MSTAPEDQSPTGQVAARRLRAAPPTPGTAQATLLNILGDIVHPADTPVPTSAFLEGMGGLGYTEPAIRQAISRCAGAGWIYKEKNGRVTRWRLTGSGVRLVEEGIAGVERLSDPHDGWNGTWQIIIVTIPNEKRSVRDRVYRALRWDGFGNPLPSVWISPYLGHHRRTRAALEESDLGQSTLAFVGKADDLGLSVENMVARAWDLPALDSLYAALVERFDAMRPGSEAEQFNALLELDEELQQLLVTDPHIPSSLTPGWAGRESAKVLLRQRQMWHVAAIRHWQSVVTRHTA